jgi:hypothetical protein
MRTHTHTYSIRSSTAGSFQLPGPSGVIPSGQHPEHQRISAGAEAKGREARMERAIPDTRLRAVNITEGVEVDPEYPPSVWPAPPPAYSREAQ